MLKYQSASLLTYVLKSNAERTMEFSFPVPKQNEILGQFSNKWFDFVSRFHCRQDLDGTSKLSFMLHFGANAIQEIGEIHQLSLEELNRFSSFVEALEDKCLFQIVITFFRYLFFNHCRKSGSWVEDFYIELRLLSEMCSFDSVAVDNFIKNHLINSFQEERVRDVLLNGANLTAKDVVDICSKVEKHPGVHTPELFQSYLIDQQQKLFQNSTKGKKDYAWTSFQDTPPEMAKCLNLSSVFRNDAHYINDVRKTNFIDNAGKFNSFSNVNFTQMDPLSDGTSYIPNKIPSLGMNFHHPSEGTSNFILPPSVHYSPTCEESSIPCSLPPPLAPNPTIPPPCLEVSSRKKESLKTKGKKGLEQLVTKQAPGTTTSVVSCHAVTSFASTVNTATSSTLTCVPGATAALDDSSESNINNCSAGEGAMLMSVMDPKLKVNDFKKESDKTSAVSLEVPKDANEIPQAYCSQQKAFLRTSQIMESSGQGVDIYACNFCVYSCSGKAAMEEHALKEHKSLKCFVCTACNVKLPSKEQFESHVRTKHMNIEEHKCQICDMVFTCQKELFSHLQGHAITRTVSCRVCTAMFSTERLLSDHMANVHPDIDRWSCRICNTGFPTRRYLADHVAKVHKDNDQDRIRRFTCNICGINFTDRKSSDMHKRKFHRKPKVRRFPCDLCSHICSSNANLISHRRIHTGEKPYICEVCGKEFAQLSSLDKHTRIHTGEKPYKCQYCELAFKTSSNRLVHERIHRNERPYVCEQCGKTFRNSYELKTHIDTHNEFRVKRFLCHCGAAFDTRKKLKRHEVSHSGIKPFKCEICGAGFTRPENLRGHQKSQACHNRASKLN